MKENINSLLLNKDSSIKETMKVIDANGLGTAFIVDKSKKFFGVVTDGDIRRAILRGIDIKRPIREIANRKPITIGYSDKSDEMESSKLKVVEKIKKGVPILVTNGFLKIPIIDKNGKVRDIFFAHIDGKNNLGGPAISPKIKKARVGKVLLIGGAGYLGSVLCRRLLNRGYRVRVLDNLSYGEGGIKDLYKNKKFELLKGDIRNISDVVEGIKGMDAVIHLAAIVGDPACAVDTRKTLEINYLATKTITEICKYFQINRFIFASSCSVYGQSNSSNNKLTEQSPLNPVSLYAETKIKCEQSILEAMDENFSPTILRMATLYGHSPNMRFDLAINILTAKAFFEKQIPIFGGNQWRPWLHLEDAADAYIKCLEKSIEKIKGEVFNVVSENYKIIKIGKIINSVFPEANIIISDKITDKRDYNVSFDKIVKALAYHPKKNVIGGVLKIREAIDKGVVKDYKDEKYRTILPQL